MKKKITIIMTAVMMIATAIAFAGCGESEPKTLEDYLANNEAARQQVEEAIKAQSGEDMNVDVSYKGNNITMTCTLATTYEEGMIDDVSKAFQDQEDTMKSTIQKSIQQIEESTGITGVSIDLIIKNGDGTEIWKGQYKNE